MNYIPKSSSQAGLVAEIEKTTMQAAFLTSPGQFTLQTIDIPEPGTQQVRVKLEGCGICASSIPVWEGREWFSYPLEAGSPGHEGWGIVDAVGAGVTNVLPGDRVAFLSYHAFAEYDLADVDALVKLPIELDQIPFPGEPLGCAINIFNRSDIRAGQTVAIVGIGFLGALLIQLAKKAGAKVVAISHRPYSLEVARQCGADETIELIEKWRVMESLKQITGEALCERVIEATGKQEPLDLAGDIVGVRGKLIIAGFHQDGLRHLNIQRWNWQGIDVINAHEREQQRYVEGMREAVEALQHGAFDPAPLYTHSFSLAEINEAFQTLVNRPKGFIKALIRF